MCAVTVASNWEVEWSGEGRSGTMTRSFARSTQLRVGGVRRERWQYWCRTTTSKEKNEWHSRFLTRGRSQTVYVMP